MSIGITRVTKYTMRGTTLGRPLKDPRFAAAQLCRLYSTPASDPHIQTLLLNTELDLDDASNELRWIIAVVRDEANKMIIRGKLPPIEEERVEELVRRRSAGEPLQYILGSADFGPINIRCQKPVLIPRPETAHIFARLSSTILSSVPSLTSSSRPSAPLPVLDLCTGTACIPLLLAHLNPLLTAVGIDNSAAAVTLGGANAKALGMEERVNVRYGNVFAESTRLLGREGKVGLVVSNPPYIPFKEWEQLPTSVKDWESPTALLGDGKKDGEGLAFYERIAEMMPDLLLEEGEMEKKGWKGVPRVAVEVGLGQARKVEEIFRSGQIKKTEVWQDQFGMERMVVGWS
ncbi:S-adenosylmethionine-dependent methyltransferase [Cryptococcus neoformans]|nr:S-adenosylmethionine-dependent methyltransferase [Cryptococcus neoformans var. grubii]OWZ31674.1 S-adenosylmethionine-dependent methyltransferase [Cryptococcus neoformans var. grubii c45]